MPRLVLSRSICLVGLCGLWSCGKQEAPLTGEKTEFQQEQKVAATAPAQADANQPIKVETDANGKKNVKLNPQQAEQLADGLMAKGQLRQANELLSRVIQLNPKATSAYVKRAAIMAESKLTTQAIADMTKAILLEPNNARFRNTRGYFHLTQQAYEPAMQDFSDAIGLDANFSQAHNNRGLARVARKEFAAGIQDFDEALKIDPKYVDAYNNKGYALMSMDKHQEAVAVLTKAIELNPKYVNAWNNRGQAYLKSKQGDKAIADFSEAIKMVPGNLTYLAARADAYTLIGKTAEADADRERSKWLTQLVKLTQQAQQNPKQPSVWIARGRHLLSSGETKPALNDFQTALKVSPGNQEAHCGCAATLLVMGQFDDAIGQCNAALAKGASPLAASIRGDAYFKKGFLDEAIEDYSTAKRRDSLVGQAYKMRAEKARAAGNAAQADADLAMAAELDPSSAKVRQVSNEQPAKN
jgi:tetratricopeptide (TPR) repeat protein